MFLLRILKDLLNLQYKKKCEAELRNFLLSEFSMVTCHFCSIKDIFSKYDKIRRKLRIWSHLLKKYLMEIFIFCVVNCFLCGVFDTDIFVLVSAKLK